MWESLTQSVGLNRTKMLSKGEFALLYLSSNWDAGHLSAFGHGLRVELKPLGTLVSGLWTCTKTKPWILSSLGY